MPGQEGPSFHSHGPPPTPCPSPFLLSSACDTNTDGNNFFQLLAEAGEACSLRSEGLLSPVAPVLLFWLQRLVPLYPRPRAVFLISCLPLWMRVLPFQFLCIGVSPSLIHHPGSSVPILLCDGNVLVNCVSNRLCVYVCLWGWFVPFAGH
uniref:Uncharacterized protein n=1 Tax=Marmota marmota marmota TaxID=9994 RepID=A0A8C5ZY59_MARMA